MSVDTFTPPTNLPGSLSDEDLVAQRAGVRGILVKRLEGLYATCDEEMVAGKDRIRWGELKLRVLKEIAALHKLAEPSSPAPVDEEIPGVEEARVRALVALSLDALEGRE